MKDHGSERRESHTHGVGSSDGTHTAASPELHDLAFREELIKTKPSH